MEPTKSADVIEKAPEEAIKATEAKPVTNTTNANAPVAIRPRSNCFLAILFVLFIFSVGIGCLTIYNSRRLKDKVNVDETPVVRSKPTPDPIETKPIDKVVEDNTTNTSDLVWLDYSNVDYADLKFKYPEGAKITLVPGKNDGVCSLYKCYELSMVYGDLAFTIKRITGIGGRNYTPGLKYRLMLDEKIIVNNIYNGNTPYEYDGLLSTEQLNADETITFGYYLFTKGDLVAVDARTVKAKLPVNNPKLQEVADTIALSLYNKQYDEEKIKWGTAYISWGENPNKSELYLIGDKGLTTKANVPYLGTNEASEILYVSPGRKYLALFTIVGQGPDRYVYFYDLTKKAFIKFNLDQTSIGFLTDAEKWVSETSFIAAAYNTTDRYIKFNLSNATFEDLTKEEYQTLFSLDD